MVFLWNSYSQKFILLNLTSIVFAFAADTYSQAMSFDVPCYTVFPDGVWGQTPSKLLRRAPSQDIWNPWPVSGDLHHISKIIKNNTC